VGTWGKRGDVGTWGRGDVGTWGRGDVGTCVTCEVARFRQKWFFPGTDVSGFLCVGRFSFS
jgi:hypothetical protein